MNLDEAMAVYLYLKKRAPGDADEAERRSYQLAWHTICEYAGKAIERQRDILDQPPR